MWMYHRRAGTVFAAAAVFCSLLVAASAGAGDTLPSETPAAFVPRVDSFDYVKREVMIPMRDGVKLQTVILIRSEEHTSELQSPA